VAQGSDFGEWGHNLYGILKEKISPVGTSKNKVFKQLHPKTTHSTPKRSMDKSTQCICLLSSKTPHTIFNLPTIYLLLYVL